MDATMFYEGPLPEEDEVQYDITHGYDITRCQWQTLWLGNLLDLIDFQTYTYLERELRLVTKLPLHEIAYTMDQCKTMEEAKYPRRTWDEISRACTLPEMLFESRLQSE